MRLARLALLLTCAATPAVAAKAAATPPPPPLTADAVDKAAFAPLPEPPAKTPSPVVMRAEIMLDRARYSPGAIDGVDGDNFRKALGAYQKGNNLPEPGKLDQATWDKLTAGTPQRAVVAYKITAKDAAGPFTKRIPSEFEAQSHLERLGYRDVVEELAERFHMNPSLLRALNPKTRFGPGDTITVANVEKPVPTEKAARIVVDKSGHNVEAIAGDGRLLAYYPASIGSTDKPAPSGDLAIRRVDRDPIYTYDPKYHFKGVAAKQPLSIAPGPNNPVGLVWMDLSGDGYGIHGTPAPEAVGKTQSHGCIRLTNWDALDLAERIAPGTPVSFGNTPGSDGPAPPPAPSVTPGEPMAKAAAPDVAPAPVPTPASAATP